MWWRLKFIRWAFKFLFPILTIPRLGGVGIFKLDDKKSRVILWEKDRADRIIAGMKFCGYGAPDFRLIEDDLEWPSIPMSDAEARKIKCPRCGHKPGKKKEK